MSKQKVIIVASRNTPPQMELEEELSELTDEWNIVSATTSVTPFGTLSEGMANSFNVPSSCAAHTYYVTTVVLQRSK
jgi:hypothetical protein